MKVKISDQGKTTRTARGKKTADGGQPSKKPRAKRKAKPPLGAIAPDKNPLSGIEPRADAHPPSYQKSGIDLIGILMIVAVVTLMSLAFLGVF